MVVAFYKVEGVSGQLATNGIGKEEVKRVKRGYVIYQQSLTHPNMPCTVVYLTVPMQTILCATKISIVDSSHR